MPLALGRGCDRAGWCYGGSRHSCFYTHRGCRCDLWWCLYRRKHKLAKRPSWRQCHQYRWRLNRGRNPLNNRSETVQANRASSPRGVTRADKGKAKGEKDHVHLDNGKAINIDGSMKHDPRPTEPIPGRIASWLDSIGWKSPGK